MKNLLALAVSAAILSPLAAHAANTPDNVGDVTYIGNIVANSPMWQWTVNDYPTRLDVKPSAATTANGATTYPLTASPFIAVSGFLPSAAPLLGTQVSVLGFADKTEFTSGNGKSIQNITGQGNGAVTFVIPAEGVDRSGNPVTGTMKLRSTEVRGYREAWHKNTDAPTSGGKTLTVFGKTGEALPRAGGSCFTGTGKFSSTAAIVSGTADRPVGGQQSETAFRAYTDALDSADSSGNAQTYSSFPDDQGNVAEGYQRSCDGQTAAPYVTRQAGDATSSYIAAAHIVELTPLELAFSTPVQGAWSSTLTVTAYQM